MNKELAASRYLWLAVHVAVSLTGAALVIVALTQGALVSLVWSLSKAIGG